MRPCTYVFGPFLQSSRLPGKGTAPHQDTQNSQSFSEAKEALAAVRGDSALAELAGGPNDPFLPFLSSFYTFSVSFLYLFCIVFTQKGIFKVRGVGISMAGKGR